MMNRCACPRGDLSVALIQGRGALRREPDRVPADSRALRGAQEQDIKGKRSFVTMSC